MYRYTAPIVLITLLLSGIASADWSSDIRLTKDPSQSHLPSIAVDAKDNLHIVWIDGRGPGIYYKKIDSSGKALVADKKIFDLNHFTGESSEELFTYDRPHICVDSMDNVNIVFDNYNRGCNPRLPPIERTKDITYAKLDSEGKSIVSSKIIKTGPGIRSTDIGSDSKGDIYVVWEGYPDVHNSTYSEDYYTKLDKDGAVLKDSGKLAAGELKAPGQQEFPRVAVDRLDNVHIIWGNGATVGSIVLDQNDARIKDQKLGISGLYSDIVADSKDVHAVIADDLTGPAQGLEYIKFDSSGNILDNFTRVLAASNGGQMHPQIDAGPTDNVHVTWFQNDSSIYYMLLSNRGAKLIPEAKITEGATASLPDLAVDSHNCVHIVWEDTRDGNSEIYYKYTCPVVPAQAEEKALPAASNTTAQNAANGTEPSAGNNTAPEGNVTAQPASKESAPSSGNLTSVPAAATTAVPVAASSAPSAPAVKEVAPPQAAASAATPDTSKAENQVQPASAQTISQPPQAAAVDKSSAQDKASFAVPSDLNKGSPAVTRVSLPVANKLKAWVDSQKDANKAAEDNSTASQVVNAAVQASQDNAAIKPDKNSGSIKMGKNDASAIGIIGKPSSISGHQAIASNNIEIKENQDSGECTPCLDNCQDACVKNDLEMIDIRDRSSSAWGSSDATNNVKIITNQG